MGLSEHERKALADIEAAIKATDAGFAKRMNGREQRRPTAGVLLLLAGGAFLLAGLPLSAWYLSVAGFCIALLGATLVYKALTGTRVTGQAAGANKGRRPSLSERAQERWERRRNGEL